MKLTNRYNLPQPFVDAVSYDDYDRGDSDYTTTELITPPRITRLTSQHWDDLEEDVSDRVWRLSGAVKHVILQRIAAQNPDRYIVEKRYFTKVDGLKISGQIDLYDKLDCHLYDWKETSVWKFMMGDTEDWEAQANINRYFGWIDAGLEITRLTNVAILRDWKLRSARTRKDYPVVAIKAAPLRIWPEGKTLDFIEDRIWIHEAAKKELPLCTDKERWADPPRWALMKKNRKRAVKLFDSEARANAGLLNAGTKDHYIEYRPTEQTRCEFYCSCAKVCSQFAALKAEQKTTHHEETTKQ